MRFFHYNFVEACKHFIFCTCFLNILVYANVQCNYVCSQIQECLCVLCPLLQQLYTVQWISSTSLKLLENYNWQKLLTTFCRSLLKIQASEMYSMLCLAYCSSSESGCRWDCASPLYTKTMTVGHWRTYSVLCTSVVPKWLFFLWVPKWTTKSLW